MSRIEELEKEISRLNKEADFLANRLALVGIGFVSCPRDESKDYPCNSADNVAHDCVSCWRKYAHKETKGLTNGKE